MNNDFSRRHLCPNPPALAGGRLTGTDDGGTDDQTAATEAELKALTDAIAAAKTLHGSAKEGTNPGQYATGSRATFKKAIDAAETVSKKANVTKAEVKEALEALAKAKVEFEKGKVPEKATVEEVNELKAAVTAAQTLYTGATEGTNPGQYATGSRATFKKAIDAAETVSKKANVTKAEVKEALEALAKAKTEFEKGKVPAPTPAPEVEVEVESVSAITTTVENGTSVEDIIAKLGTTVTGQLNDEAKTKVELNVEWSAPADFDATKADEYTFTGKVTVADEEATYTIGEDVVATAVVTVEEVKEEAYINSFEKVTTELTVGATGFTVKAFDQYGEVVEEIKNVEVKATLNTHLPLTASIDKAGLVTLSGAALAEDDEVVVTLTVKDGEEVKSTTKIAYTVIKGEAQVVTSVTLKADKTSVPYGNAITFTAESKDQYNNAMTFTTKADGKDVEAPAYTWVVNGEKVKDDKGLSTFVLNETKPGEYTVTVVSQKNTKVAATQKVVIGAAELKTLSVVDAKDAPVTTASGYNTETTTIGTVDYTEDAVVTAADVKFDVVATGDVTAADLSVVAEADKDGNILVKATAAKDKSGSYKITPYVMYGETKVAAKEITFTSKKSTKVASISDFAFDATELKVNATVTKEVTLTNVNGEKLVVGTGKDIEASALKISKLTSNGEEASALTATLNNTNEEGKTTLTFTATAADTYVVTLTAGEGFTPVTKTLKFVAPIVSTIEAGADVKGLVVKEDYTHYQEISFADQDKVAVDVKSDDTKLEVAVVDAEGKVVTDKVPTVSLVEVTKDKDGNVVKVADDAADKKDIKNGVAVSTEGADEGTYIVQVSYKVDEKTTVKDTFKVTVGEARKVNTITVTPASDTIALKAQNKYTVNIVDQYGKPFNANVTIPALTGLTINGPDQSTDDKGANIKGQYEFTVTGQDTGKFDVVINALAVGGVEADTKSIKLPVEVKAVSELISDIKLTGTNFNEDGTYKYKVDAKEAKEYASFVTVKGLVKGSTAEVNLDASDIEWGSSKQAVATIASNGTLTIKEAVTEDTEVTFIANVQGVTKSFTVVLSKEDSQLDTKTLEVVDANKIDTDADKAGVQVKLDNDTSDGEKDGAIELTFTGLDQYGVKAADEALKDLTVKSTNSSVATVSPEATVAGGQIKISAVKAGTANVRVTVNATAVLVLDVKVTQEAVDAAKAKALSDAITVAYEGTAVTDAQVKLIADAKGTKKASGNIYAHASSTVLGIDEANALQGNPAKVALGAETKGQILVDRPFAQFVKENPNGKENPGNPETVYVAALVAAPAEAKKATVIFNSPTGERRVTKKDVAQIDGTYVHVVSDLTVEDKTKNVSGITQYLNLAAKSEGFSSDFTVVWFDAEGNVVSQVETFTFKYAPKATTPTPSTLDAVNS